jgi:hypothetical protein
MKGVFAVVSSSYIMMGLNVWEAPDTTVYKVRKAFFLRYLKKEKASLNHKNTNSD